VLFATDDWFDVAENLIKVSYLRGSVLHKPISHQRTQNSVVSVLPHL
jgi:hypothetical protein